MQQITFGKLIRDARKQKGYSQKQLADLVYVTCGYLSKLENDRTDYPPSEDLIRSLADKLDLPNVEDLTYRACRIPKRDEDFVKQHNKEILALFRRMQEDPNFAKRVLRQDRQSEDEEAQS